MTTDRILSLLPLVLVFGQILAFGANSAPLAAAASLASGLVGLAALWAMGDDVVFWRRLTKPALIFCFALAWACIPIIGKIWGAPMAPKAISLDAALGELTKLAALSGPFIVGAVVGRSSRRRGLFMDAAIWGSLAYLLLAVWLWRLEPDRIWGASKGAHAYRFTATLLNANAAACMIGALCLIAAGRLTSALEALRSPIGRLQTAIAIGFCLITIVLGLWAIMLTQSRVGLAGLSTMMALLLLFLPRRPGDGAQRRTIRLVMLAGTLALAAVLAVGGAPTLDRPVVADDVGIRLAAWRMHFALAERSPWFGYGLGAFRQLHEAHLAKADAVGLWNLGAVHQPLLQAALEGGVPFALLLSAAVVALMLPVPRALGRARAGRVWGRSMAAAAGLILFDSSVDIALNVPAIATLFVLLLGLLWGWATVETATPDPDPVGGEQ